MNFNALVSQIQGDLNDYSARSKTRIEKWVNEGHKKICQERRWRFLSVIKSDTMTITAGAIIDLTTDIEVSSSAVAASAILNMYDVTDGTYEEVKKIEHSQLRDSYQTDYGETSNPIFFYYLSATTIQVFPLTAEDRDFIFSFKPKIATYATGVTTALLIPDDYIDVLGEYVLYKAYRYKSDPRSQACLDSYSSLMDSMIKAESNKADIIYDEPQEVFSIFPTLVDDS